MSLHSRVGFEVELLAPVGASRLTLASELARAIGGTVRTIWHQDSELSLVPDLGRFLILTLGFEVLDAVGQQLCTLVDDVTLNADLAAGAPPVPGWHRILTDDIRLLRLLALQCDPTSPPQAALASAAYLWSGKVDEAQGVWRLEDSRGATIALAAPQGGQRERGCEIVTPPLVADHAEALEALLAPARALGFCVPVEAAVHVHVDGAPFRHAAALANVIRLFAWWREPLRRLLGTNPHCARLAPLPTELVAMVDGTPTSEELGAAATRGGLTKFFDVNLTQLLMARPIRDTLEVRILPGAIHAEEILAGAVRVERLLERCQDPTPIPRPPAVADEALLALQRLGAI